jgi:hypothetical protein
MSTADKGITFTVSAVAAPSWASAIPVGTWRRISGSSPDGGLSATNTLQNVIPGSIPSNVFGSSGPASVIHAWSGGAYASDLGSSGSLICYGGGHTDYEGNEVYRFDLATRTWSRLSNAYQGVSWPRSSGIWPDGTPGVVHTYKQGGYHPGTKSYFCIRVQTNLDASELNKPVFFDTLTNTWRVGVQNSGGFISFGGYAVYDSSRDCIWGEGGDSGGSFGRYAMNGNGTAGTWTNFANKGNYGYQVATRDPVNDILIVARFTNGFSVPNNVAAIALASPGNSAIVLNTANNPTTNAQCGWEWSETKLAVIYWDSGANVYQLKQGSGSFSSATWTYTNLTSGANTVTPTKDSRGTYNRFQLCKWGSVEVAIVVNDWAQPVYAFRIN